MRSQAHYAPELEDSELEDSDLALRTLEESNYIESFFLSEVLGVPLEEVQDRQPTLYPLHPTPYTLHPTSYTRHPTPDTRHPTPDTRHLNPTPYTLHPAHPAP
eukprot:2469252-Rhodomonas_salina.2